MPKVARTMGSGKTPFLPLINHTHFLTIHVRWKGKLSTFSWWTVNKSKMLWKRTEQGKYWTLLDKKLYTIIYIQDLCEKFMMGVVESGATLEVGSWYFWYNWLIGREEVGRRLITNIGVALLLAVSKRNIQKGSAVLRCPGVDSSCLPPPHLCLYYSVCGLFCFWALPSFSLHFGWIRFVEWGSYSSLQQEHFFACCCLFCSFFLLGPLDWHI